MVVIFDPEGVLTDTAGCSFAAWREMAREQGITYDETMAGQLAGMNATERLLGILSHARRSYTAAERLALLTRQSDLMDDLLDRLGEGIQRPGAETLIKALKNAGVHLGAVMSDGLPGRVLGRLALGRWFDVMSRQEDILSQLSDVQLRLHAAPDQCLLVTAFPGSAKAARSLGMQALLCGRGDDLTALGHQLDAILTDFTE